MAAFYTLNFTDSINKSDFIIAPYTANGILSPSDPTPIPRASGAQTTLKFYGKGMQEYGEGIEQNFVYMLEHFANSTRPEKSIEGQIWYNNIGMGSPPAPEQLFIRNATDPLNTLPINDLSGWDAIILSTGSSVMTGELILSGTPTNPLGAVPKSYVDAQSHLSPDQQIFLDGLLLPTLTSTEVNQLIGLDTINPLQTQLDSKISKAGDVMDSGANLSLLFGEILGLPPIPSVDDAAASKLYVDTQVGTGSGDGVLTAISWQGNDLKFDIFINGFITTSLFATGVSQVGHQHQATSILYDNIINPAVPVDIQGAVDYLETNKADLLNPIFVNDINVTNNVNAQGGNFASTVSALDPTGTSDLTTKSYVDNLLVASNNLTVTRTLEILLNDLTAGSPLSTYTTQPHNTGDNLLSLTINGMKQYGATAATQQIRYGTEIDFIGLTTFTGLDSAINYDFDITINSNPPILVTLLAGNVIDTHGDLVNEINIAMQLAGVGALFSISNNIGIHEAFTGLFTGSSNTLTISDPGTIDQYLFAVDASPLTINSVVFNNTPPGSPVIPDEIIISGDVTATFTVGKTFTIKGSDEPLSGTYDGVYSVHTNGAIYDGVSLTNIPVARIDDPSVIEELIIAASAPSPSSFGFIHVTPLAGIDVVLPALAGIDGDYIETDAGGNEIFNSQQTNHVVFNTTIPTGALIETILLG